MTTTTKGTLAEILVHSVGWRFSPEYEQFPISLVGHVIPKVYVLIAEVFALPRGTDTEKIIKDMTTGLQLSLSQFSVLIGILEMNADTGRMWVTRKRNSTVSLHIKHMIGPDEFPSYDEVVKQDVRT